LNQSVHVFALGYFLKMGTSEVNVGTKYYPDWPLNPLPTMH